MVGSKNSVWSRLKLAAPKCVLARCVCHSLALCAKHAFKKLPSNLEFMLQEIPKWFKHSALRRAEYAEVYDVMNEDLDDDPKPYATSMSRTRWLVRGKVMNSIMMNWDTLCAYFTSLPEDAGNRFTVRLLRRCYRTETTTCNSTSRFPLCVTLSRLTVSFKQMMRNRGSYTRL